MEVDLFSVYEHNECFNEDGNWDGIVAELNPNHESDDEESENEDVRDNIEQINLENALPSIVRHRAPVSELNHTTLMNLLGDVEKYNNVIINKRMKNVTGAHVRILQEHIMTK